MLSTDLSKLTLPVSDHRHFSLDPDATKLAAGIRQDLVRAVARLQPSTLAAIAAARYPERGMVDGLNQLAADIAEDIKALDGFQTRVKGDYQADQTRLAPLVQEATRRLFVATQRAVDLAHTIKVGQSQADGQRARLKQAGLDGERLDAACAQFDSAPLAAERLACVAEAKLLEQFLATMDEALLPAGFEVRAEFQTTPQDHG